MAVADLPWSVWAVEGWGRIKVPDHEWPPASLALASSQGEGESSFIQKWLSFCTIATVLPDPGLIERGFLALRGFMSLCPNEA